MAVLDRFQRAMQWISAPGVPNGGAYDGHEYGAIWSTGASFGV